jgi:hypothetical protein
MSDHSSLRRLATRGILGSSRRIYSHQTLQSGRSGQLRERPMAEPVPIDEKYDFSVERSSGRSSWRATRTRRWRESVAISKRSIRLGWDPRCERSRSRCDQRRGCPRRHLCATPKSQRRSCGNGGTSLILRHAVVNTSETMSETSEEELTARRRTLAFAP